MKFNSGRILALLLILVIVTAVIYRSYSDKSLGKNGKVIKALITKVESGTRASIVISYQYEVGGERYNDDSKTFLNLQIRDSLVGRFIPVIYLDKNPSVNKLLLEEMDFNNVNLNMPDSLSWVKKFKN